MSVATARALQFRASDEDSSLERYTSWVVKDSFHDGSMSVEQRLQAFAKGPAALRMFHHRVRYQHGLHRTLDAAMSQFGEGKPLGAGAGDQWVEHATVVACRVRTWLFHAAAEASVKEEKFKDEPGMHIQYYLSVMLADDAVRRLHKQKGMLGMESAGTNSIDQRQRSADLELLMWLAVCRLDLLLSWHYRDYRCSLQAKPECVPGGRLSVKDLQFLRHIRWLGSRELEDEEHQQRTREGGLPPLENACGITVPDMATLFRTVYGVLAHYRECTLWHPAAGRYITRLYLRMCHYLSYSELPQRDNEQTHMFFGRFGMKVFHGDRRHGMLNHLVFFRRRSVRGYGKVQMPNKRFQRESELVFRSLIDAMHPRAQLIERPLPPPVLLGAAHNVHAAIRMANWAVKVAEGVLHDMLCGEMKRRLYQIHLQPCERERYQREEQFGDPSAYNVLCRYRPETVDKIADWVEGNEENVLLIPLRARLKALQAYAEGRAHEPEPVPLPLPDAVESLAYEIVLKFSCDTMDYSGCLTSWIVERYRRTDGIHFRPPDGGEHAPVLVQLFNEFELLTDAALHTVATLPSQNGPFGMFLPRFLAWLWMVRSQPAMRLRSIHLLIARVFNVPNLLEQEEETATATTKRKAAAPPPPPLENTHVLRIDY